MNGEVYNKYQNKFEVRIYAFFLILKDICQRVFPQLVKYHLPTHSSQYFDGVLQTQVGTNQEGVMLNPSEGN